MIAPLEAWLLCVYLLVACGHASAPMGAREGQVSGLVDDQPPAWAQSMVEALKELRAEVTALEPADGSVTRAAPASPQPASAATPVGGWTQQICLTHVYFGAVETSYPYMDYVLESMRYNKKNVKFVILNVRDRPEEARGFATKAKDMGVSNLQILPMTFSQWGERVKQKVGVDVPWDQSWYYKVNDYKPTFGAIFEEHCQGADWFGWMDIDGE